ncbi:MAG: hypothetical protein NZ703_03900, partial [Gemmataceae bacterium]|nr:hypothetical protein [Gemmataceae bacterium]
RDLARKHGFRLCETIADALTLGSGRLAVDGVLSIAEHGQYPQNDKGQILYPRRRFFSEICAVFSKTGLSVPVFNDKHLAASWDDAWWMYTQARKLMIPLLAGSSIPVTWRKPDLVLPRGCELLGAVQVGYGPLEGYGFHALEGLQCMVERRKLPDNDRQGVLAVTCHTGKAMWERFDQFPWARRLWEAIRPLIGYHAGGDVRPASAKAPDAAIFEIEYIDGLRAFVLMPNGWLYESEGGSFYFAALRREAKEPDVCQFYLQQPDPFAHFAELTKAIDHLIQTGHAPYPVERTLLTTGILDAAMTSRAEKGRRLLTAHLRDIRYCPSEWKHAQGPIPPPIKRP